MPPPGPGVWQAALVIGQRSPMAVRNGLDQVPEIHVVEVFSILSKLFNSRWLLL